MIPFIEKCLMISFPVNQIQGVLLVPESDLESLLGMFKLDIHTIFGSNIIGIIPELKKNIEHHEKVMEEKLPEKTLNVTHIESDTSKENKLSEDFTGENKQVDDDNLLSEAAISNSQNPSSSNDNE